VRHETWTEVVNRLWRHKKKAKEGDHKSKKNARKSTARYGARWSVGIEIITNNDHTMRSGGRPPRERSRRIVEKANELANAEKLQSGHPKKREQIGNIYLSRSDVLLC
jgi:hypothetical protein